MEALSVALVGGGAAGLMAAATLAEARPGVGVTLYERNPRLGAKVAISGGGRCNVTTGTLDVPTALGRYPRGARWLRHAMHSFPPSAAIAWFEGHGVPLKTETDGRVFPVSDRGRDVVDAFERVFLRHGVEVRLRAAVTGLEREGCGFRVLAGGDGCGEVYDAVILTTGGQAYRRTGSTGDGYGFAAALGHTITPLHPSLNAYVVREGWAQALSGLAFADVGLEIAPRNGGRPYRFRGAMLFTHFGVTGPAVFALNALAAGEPHDERRPLSLEVNLMPDLTVERIDERLRERLGRLGGRGVANVLDTLLPRSICPALCDLAAVDPALPAARLPRAGRQRLAGLIAALPLTIVGRKNGEEFVTAGGVALDEVDGRTMASRLVPGLSLAGEILDVDGFTGGYNLQAAWATGRLAGLSAATRGYRVTSAGRGDA